MSRFMHPYAGESPSTFPAGPDKCPEGDLVAWDEVDDVCYYIVGLGITIDDIVASNEGAMNVFNMNIHRNGTQRPLPTLLSLKSLGAVSV